MCCDKRERRQAIVRGGCSGNSTAEAWTPVRDRENEWISVGCGGKKQCQLYSESVQGRKRPPRWGRAKQDKPFKGLVKCCDGGRQEAFVSPEGRTKKPHLHLKKALNAEVPQELREAHGGTLSDGTLADEHGVMVLDNAQAFSLSGAVDG